MRNVILLASLLTATALPAQAQSNEPAPQPAPPVCLLMPERLGHFWAEFDWCRWFADYDNNRERRDREKSVRK